MYTFKMAVATAAYITNPEYRNTLEFMHYIMYV